MRRNDSQSKRLVGNVGSDKVLPAMPIKIMFFAVDRDVSWGLAGKEHIFYIRMPKVFSPGLGFYLPDAYALRDSFEAIKSPEDAFDFLKICGDFRRMRTRYKEDVLTWSEFDGWKALVKRLHLREPWEWFPLLGDNGPECKDLFLRFYSESFKGESAETAKQIWKVSDETFNWLQGRPSGWSVQRDMNLSYEETKVIFSAPGATIPDSKAWHEAQAILALRRRQRAIGNKEGKQKLFAHVVVGTALDAILATIYIDKLRGKRTEVCALANCERIFEIKSNHGQKYCCNYHAHLASVRRNRPKPKAKKRKPTGKKGQSQ